MLYSATRLGALLAAAVRARSLAEEAAEGRFGEATTLPQDRWRRAFRLLRHEPRPGVSVGALSLLCRFGALADPRRALAGLCRSVAAPCSCPSGMCRRHERQIGLDVRLELRRSLMLDTDLFAAPGRTDPGFLQVPDRPRVAAGGIPGIPVGLRLERCFRTVHAGHLDDYRPGGY